MAFLPINDRQCPIDVISFVVKVFLYIYYSPSKMWLAMCLMKINNQTANHYNIFTRHQRRFHGSQC